MAADLVPLDREPARVAGLRPAGVLALVDPRSPSLRLLLIHRHRGLRFHPGQIGLPGGSHDPADGPLWRTALREAYEELGVPPEAVTALGYAPTVPVANTGFLITPLVGALQRPFAARIAAAEVESYFWMPLRARGSSVQLVHRRVDTHRGPLMVPGYLFGEHFVWGATGIIIDDLRRRLGEPVAGPPPTT